MEWQPIETCPLHTPVLLFVPPHGDTEGRVYWGHEALEYSEDFTKITGTGFITEDHNGNYSDFPIAPTHWMPLPEPPN